ncbi:SpoIIE family protein phosphatase [Kitasatospora sp. NPDC054939]
MTSRAPHGAPADRTAAAPAGRPPDPGDGETVLALAAAVRRLERAVAELRTEERPRALVDLATGILAERLHCPPADAAAQLVRLARDAGTTPAALAADVAGQPAPPPPGTADPQAPPGPAPHPEAGAALAAASDLGAGTRALLDQAAMPLGARAVAVWQAVPGGALVLAAQAGLPAAEAEAWNRVPPGVDTAAQRAVRTGAAHWPDRVDGAPGIGGPDLRRAVLPLHDRGRRTGALELLWPGAAPDLGPPLRRQLAALADLCATLLGAPAAAAGTGAGGDADRAAVLDGVLGPALLLDPVAGPDGRTVDFRIVRTNEQFTDPLGRSRTELEGASLLESYPTACAAGLYDRLLRAHTAGETVRDERLDLAFHAGDDPLPAAVRLAAAPLGPGLLVSWNLATARDRQAALLQQAQRLAKVSGFEESTATGRILWNEGLRELYGLPPGAAPVPLAELTDHAHPDDEPAVRRLLDTVHRRLRPSSAVFRLQRPDGPPRYTRVVAEPVTDAEGRLTAVRGAYHDISAQHTAEIALGATRARLADSEQEAAESEQLALRLQQAILPPEPPPLGTTGLHAAVRYRPAARRARVGGDWYDVMLLPDKRVLLAVGDIAGHGVEAATGMVALRHALRGLAVTGAGPGRLLAWANTVALRDQGHVTATAVCAVFDPVDSSLRWARAGHLPPVLLTAGRADVLPLPHGILLGALEDAAYEEHTLQLGPADVLLLYTDGLVERRDRPVEESVHQLIRIAGDPRGDLDGYLDRLLELSRADTDDDTCLIAVRVERPAAPGPEPAAPAPRESGRPG